MAGEIPRQQVSSAMIGAIDLLPTLAEACDITLPPRSGNQPPIDGVSVLNTLKAHTDRTHPRTSLLFGMDGGLLKLFAPAPGNSTSTKSKNTGIKSRAYSIQCRNRSS